MKKQLFFLSIIFGCVCNWSLASDYDKENDLNTLNFSFEEHGKETEFRLNKRKRQPEPADKRSEPKAKQQDLKEKSDPFTTPKSHKGQGSLGQVTPPPDGAGVFYESHSPLKIGDILVPINERAIYSMIVVEKHDDDKIPPEGLINGNDLFDGDEFSEDDVDEALLLSERIIETWILENKTMARRTIYVGLSKNVENRFPAHRRNMNSERTQFYSRLAAKINIARAEKLNIRLRPLIFNLPQRLLPLFECLTSKLFSERVFGCSAIIGNKRAWARLQQYWQGELRRDAIDRGEITDARINRERELQLAIWAFDGAATSSSPSGE